MNSYRGSEATKANIGKEDRVKPVKRLIIPALLHYVTLYNEGGAMSFCVTQLCDDLADCTKGVQVEEQPLR